MTSRVFRLQHVPTSKAACWRLPYKTEVPFFVPLCAVPADSVGTEPGHRGREDHEHCETGSPAQTLWVWTWRLDGNEWA